MRPQDVLLFADATRLRLFPPLRAAWARVGEPAIVPATGRNDRCALFGALNVCTGHRIVVRQPRETGPGARALLTEIRRRYRRAPTIWVLLDQGSAHTAAPTRQLAADLRIELVWLPRQTSVLSSLFREEAGVAEVVVNDLELDRVPQTTPGTRKDTVEKPVP